MTQFVTYLYLLTAMHPGGSASEGNLMGIAREVHLDFPYLPASSVRGRIRSELEARSRQNPQEILPIAVDLLFGKKIKEGQQPTEGEVWFGDAGLLLFPIASFSHQYLWVTCPLWLSRWNRWVQNPELDRLIQEWRLGLASDGEIKAFSPIGQRQIYLQGALLNADEIGEIQKNAACWSAFKHLPTGNGILDLPHRLVVLSDGDCGTLVELGLQREVHIAINSEAKTAAEGSFRSEEAIPSETVLFFPWAFKPDKQQVKQEVVLPEKSAEEAKTLKLDREQATPKEATITGSERRNLPEKQSISLDKVRSELQTCLNQRLQFGGLEGLGRGWCESKTLSLQEISDSQAEKKTVSSNANLEA